jgi:hypothetical protein
VYKELFALRSVIVGVLVCCIFYLIGPFVALWLGEEYLLSDMVVFMICAQIYLALMSETTDQFLYGYGMFYDVWAPVAESILFIVFSIVFGSQFGLPGILAGPVGSYLTIIYCWKPYFLYSRGLKKSVARYYIMLLTFVIPTIITYFVSAKVCSYAMALLSIDNGWLAWCVKAFIYTLLVFIILFIICYPLSDGLRNFTKRMLKRKKQ